MYKKIISYTVLFYIIFNLKSYIKNKINKNNLNEDEHLNKNNYLMDKIRETLLKYKLKLSKSIDDISEKNKIQDNYQDNNQNIQCDKIVLYEHKKQTNYNLKDIYNNFFFKKPYKIDKDLYNLNQNLSDNLEIKNESKNNIILLESKNNIFLNEENNFLLYNFQCNKNNFYKIKYHLKLNNNIKNIKLIINDSNKNFIYDFLEENEYLDFINKFSFTLNYNYFNVEDSIFIYILFYNDIMNDIKIKTCNMEIIENKITKDCNLNDSIIIFNINDKYIPIYTKVHNILDYKKNNNHHLFFF